MHPITIESLIESLLDTGGRYRLQSWAEGWLGASVRAGMFALNAYAFQARPTNRPSRDVFHAARGSSRRAK